MAKPVSDLTLLNVVFKIHAVHRIVTPSIPWGCGGSTSHKVMLTLKYFVWITISQFLSFFQLLKHLGKTNVASLSFLTNLSYGSLREKR